MIWATRGGVVLGLAILLWYLIKWYPGKKALLKKPMEHAGRLLPFALGWAYGVLGVLSALGVIGWAFDTALWASNWLGDAALWLGVGEAPGQASRGTYLPLDGLGNCVVLLLTVAVVAVVKSRPSGRDVKLGTWSGLCLGTSSGVAGLAAVPLAQAANWVGAVTIGVIA